MLPRYQLARARLPIPRKLCSQFGVYRESEKFYEVLLFDLLQGTKPAHALLPSAS